MRCSRPRTSSTVRLISRNLSLSNRYAIQQTMEIIGDYFERLASLMLRCTTIDLSAFFVSLMIQITGNDNLQVRHIESDDGSLIEMTSWIYRRDRILPTAWYRANHILKSNFNPSQNTNRARKPILYACQRQKQRHADYLSIRTTEIRNRQIIAAMHNC